MTIRPDFGPDYGEEERRDEGALPPEPDDAAERELTDREIEEQEIEHFDPEGNEAHAPGAVCERCGTVITAGQDVRRRLDGRWVHDECPG